MTPTEQDNELREKLRAMIRGYLRHYTDSARDSSVYANEVLSLITADRKRVALEARIAELKHIREFWGQAIDRTLSDKPFNFVALQDIDNRIESLKAGK